MATKISASENRIIFSLHCSTIALLFGDDKQVRLYGKLDKIFPENAPYEDAICVPHKLFQKITDVAYYHNGNIDDSLIESIEKEGLSWKNIFKHASFRNYERYKKSNPVFKACVSYFLESGYYGMALDSKIHSNDFMLEQALFFAIEKYDVCTERQTILNKYTFGKTKYEFLESTEDTESLKDGYFKVRALDSNRVETIKIGKFVNAESGNLPEKIRIALAERVAADWRTYVEEVSKFKSLRLVVNKDFAAIYDPYNYCCDTFGSCMEDADNSDFYSYYINASAAKLVDENGSIWARCVIYNKVIDADSGEVFRLAERGYACEAYLTTLKKLLVNKLIEEGYIDGYKDIMVDCHSNREFLLNDGTSLRDRTLYIDNEAKSDDTLSYQDSFVYLDINSQRAYNRKIENDSYFSIIKLNSTDGYVPDAEFYDELRGEYFTSREISADEIVEAYAWRGGEMQLFKTVKGTHSGTNVSYNAIGDAYYSENALYESERLGEYYPKDMIDQMLDDEREYVLNDID